MHAKARINHRSVSLGSLTKNMEIILIFNEPGPHLEATLQLKKADHSIARKTIPIMGPYDTSGFNWVLHPGPGSRTQERLLMETAFLDSSPNTVDTEVL